MVSVVSVNCTTINMEFKPSSPKRSNLFEFDPIRYMCYGNGEFACRYDEWTGAALDTYYKELKTVIPMRRQSTTYYKPEEVGDSKIYTWDTPEKEQINNYEAFNSGMLKLGFRFNFNQQTRAVVRFKDFGNLVENIGGFQAAVVTFFTGVYAILCGRLIKRGLLSKIDKDV